MCLISDLFPVRALPPAAARAAEKIAGGPLIEKAKTRCLRRGDARAPQPQPLDIVLAAKSSVNPPPHDCELRS